jgi:hypothetical protein
MFLAHNRFQQIVLKIVHEAKHPAMFGATSADSEAWPDSSSNVMIPQILACTANSSRLHTNIWFWIASIPNSLKFVIYVYQKTGLHNFDTLQVCNFQVLPSGLFLAFS